MMGKAKMDKRPLLDIRGCFNRIVAIIGFFATPHQVTIFLNRLRGVHIGRDAFIGRYVYIDERNPDKVFIGDGVAVSAGATILAHQRDLREHRPGKWAMGSPLVTKEVHIEEGAHIGVKATILPGVTVGRGAIVAAGAVVVKDVAPYTLVAGVPAKQIKEYHE